MIISKVIVEKDRKKAILNALENLKDDDGVVDFRQGR